MWNILFSVTSVASTFPGFYQHLIKSESRRGHFHKYANTRSHHHLCLMSFWILEPPRGYSRVESVVCVAHSPVFPVLCTLHPPCNLQSVSMGYFTHIWYLDPVGSVWSFLKPAHTTGIVPVGRLCMFMWNGGGGGLLSTLLELTRL